MVPTGNYTQQTQYQLPHQQQMYLGAYSYPTPTVRKIPNLRLIISSCLALSSGHDIC